MLAGRSIFLADFATLAGSILYEDLATLTGRSIVYWVWIGVTVFGEALTETGSGITSEILLSSRLDCSDGMISSSKDTLTSSTMLTSSSDSGSRGTSLVKSTASTDS